MLDTIWVIIQVDDCGTLALMQQMVNLKELGSSPPVAPPPSPAHPPQPLPSATNPFSARSGTPRNFTNVFGMQLILSDFLVYCIID